MNPDCAASASSSLLATAPEGEDALAGSGILYHYHHVHTNISHGDTVEISISNLSAVFPCSSATTVLSSGCENKER